MKVYVSGASAEIERAERWSKALRDAGIEVVSTWPEKIREAGVANPTDVEREVRAEMAAEDLMELEQATVVWLLLPNGTTSHGAYTELGYALLLRDVRTEGLHILASGTEQSIFTAMVDHYPTDEDAFTVLDMANGVVTAANKLML